MLYLVAVYRREVEHLKIQYNHFSTVKICTGFWLTFIPKQNGIYFDSYFKINMLYSVQITLELAQ